jgi:hypothetical protein
MSKSSRAILVGRRALALVSIYLLLAGLVSFVAYHAGFAGRRWALSVCAIFYCNSWWDADLMFFLVSLPSAMVVCAVTLRLALIREVASSDEFHVVAFGTLRVISWIWVVVAWASVFTPIREGFFPIVLAPAYLLACMVRSVRLRVWSACALVAILLHPFLPPEWEGLGYFVISPSAGLVAGLIAPYLRSRPPIPGRCRECGYDLTGNVSGICPECGLGIVVAESD